MSWRVPLPKGTGWKFFQSDEWRELFIPAIFLSFKNAFLGLPSFHSGYPAFLAKKMAAGFFIFPRNSENRYTFSQKNSELMNINVKLHENKDVYFFCRKQQNLHSQYFCDCCKKDQYPHKCCYWNGICFCDILFRHWLYNLWRFF